MGARKSSLLCTPGPGVSRKLDAAETFVNKLLESPAGAHVAKILLFGSLARGEATTDSDVDLMVIGAGALPLVTECSNNAAFDRLLATGEDVEPLVRSLNEWREPSTWLMYRVRLEGKEMYSMDAKAIRRREIDGLYDLASMYLQATNRILASGAEDEGSIRVAIDAGYNAIELCAKAFLLSRLDTLPKSHGGVKTLFSDHFVKRGVLPREFGRRLSHCLRYRNEARYDPAAEVTSDKAREAARLTAEMLEALGKQPC